MAIAGWDGSLDERLGDARLRGLLADLRTSLGALSPADRARVSRPLEALVLALDSEREILLVSISQAMRIASAKTGSKLER